MALIWQDFIEERKDVMLGKPVFKGTRLTVEHILRELGTGISQDELFDSYPNLKPEHVQAALQYAADVVSMDQCIYQWVLKRLVFRDRLNSHGVILLRMGDFPVSFRLARLQAVWTTVERNLPGKFLVVTASKLRLRALAPPP